MPGIKRGRLLKMMDAITSGDRRVKLSHILQYIDANVVEDTTLDNVKLPFESPLPAFVVANDELRAELAPDKKTGDSVLRRAVMGGYPARIIAALCQLAPDALMAADHRGRVVLHLSCLLPVSAQSIEVLSFLVKAHPNALLARDEGGRTPLHYLCWFHGPDRSPEIVALFCTRLPKTKFYGLKQTVDADKKHPLPEIPRPQARIPNSAVILPDSKHGCIPLHYAVANQCSSEVLTVLLQIFPLSKHITDRYGRTALHWCLGAGHSGCTTHVSGEAPNPHEAPWWQRTLDDTVLTLLLSSRVARTTDWRGRHVLHWAAEKMARSLYHAQGDESFQLSLGDLSTAIKAIRSNFTGQIVGKDDQGQTPVMVFLDTIQKCQHESGMRQVALDMEILQLLLDYPGLTDSQPPASLEDLSGRLPLHAAVEIGSPHDVVELIVQQHPTALIHTSETYQAPLHAAFSSHVASMQTTKVLEVLLQTYTAGSQETLVVDGRIALKLEDANGSFPIHYAAENQASLEVLQKLVQSYPPVCLQQRSDGNLAIHCLVRSSMVNFLTLPVAASGSTQVAPVHSEADFKTDREKLQIFFPFLLGADEKLRVKGSCSQMTPLHIAVLFQVVERLSLLRILRSYPEAALLFTSDPDYSVLDLHEFARQRWIAADSDWHLVREMLFAFVPTLASHRHRQELLGRCVRIVIDEVSQSGHRHHFAATQLLDKETRSRHPPLQVSHTLSGLEAKARIHLNIRSPRKKTKTKVRKASRQNKSRHSKHLIAMKSNESEGKLKVSSSIYDEEDAKFDYDVSSESYSEDEDDESSYFSEEDAYESTDGEEDEANYTDEYDDGQETTLQQSTYTSHDDYPTDYNSLLTGPSGHSESFTSFHRSASIEERTGSGSLTNDFSTSFESSRQPKLLRTKHGLVVPGPIQADAFDRAQKATEDEEKKEDDEKNDTAENESKKIRHEVWDDRPEFLSDVGMRLWTFFAMFADEGNPNDNYVDKISAIFDEIPFARVETLTLLKLPSYAPMYLEQNKSAVYDPAATFREIANPKVRELIHKTCYFLGKYDFSGIDNRNVLVQRHPSGRYIILRAFEWNFTTQEITDATNPGISEAEIWKTGELPAEIGLTFSSQKRSVVVKFTADPDEYQDEVLSRETLGSSDSLVPLLARYRADMDDTKENRTYRTDIHDARFNKLDIGNGEVICLDKFPYALVYPETTSLLDLYRRRGFNSDEERRKLCKDIGMVLLNLHSRNIVHGGISLSKVVRLNDGSAEQQWMLSDCIGCVFTDSSSSNALGRVSRIGNLLTTPMSVPPEHIVQATPAQLRYYRKYWASIQQKYGIVISEEVQEPRTTVETGETYFLRYNYCNPNADEENNVPPPPYALHYATSATDLWAFGLLVFEIYAGRPLIPYDERSGSPFDFSALAKWDEKKAKALIYGCIKNPLAQDLLLQLLGSESRRDSLHLYDILMHPLFLPGGLESSDGIAISERRRIDTAAYKRLLQSRLQESSTSEWLDSRSVSIMCFDASILERFLWTPTDLVRQISGNGTKIAFPCTNILLPYRLRRIEDGVSGPEHTHDLLRIEIFGAALLSLNKVCRFASILRRKMEGLPKQTNWTISGFLALSTDDFFDDIKNELSSMASNFVESFRDEPMFVVKKLIQDRIIDVLSYFADDDKEIYFYLVDEFQCIPLVDRPVVLAPTSDDKRSELILCSVLGMQMTVVYAMHQFPHGEGVMQLLNESGAGEVPSSWSHLLLPVESFDASNASNNMRDMLVDDLTILEDAFSSLEVSSESSGGTHRRSLNPEGDLRMLRHLVEDRLPDWGNLYRVIVPGVNGSDEASLWTQAAVAEELRRQAQQSTWRNWLVQQPRRHSGPRWRPNSPRHHQYSSSPLTESERGMNP